MLLRRWRLQSHCCKCFMQQSRMGQRAIGDLECWEGHVATNGSHQKLDFIPPYHLLNFADTSWVDVQVKERIHMHHIDTCQPMVKSDSRVSARCIYDISSIGVLVGSYRLIIIHNTVERSQELNETIHDNILDISGIVCCHASLSNNAIAIALYGLEAPSRKLRLIHPLPVYIERLDDLGWVLPCKVPENLKE